MTKKKIKLVDKMINQLKHDDNIIELYSDMNCTHNLLCEKINNKYFVEIENDSETTHVPYDMKNEEHVNELLSLLLKKI